MRGEQKPDFIIDARTPEMIADIERKRPELKRRLEEINRRASSLFEATGNMQSSIEQVVREVHERE